MIRSATPLILSLALILNACQPVNQSVHLASPDGKTKIAIRVCKDKPAIQSCGTDSRYCSL
ncbi:MAG: hypothetical protein U0T82_00660 [Bacteroidales bacterium]